jgi:hypothetical protein
VNDRLGTRLVLFAAVLDLGRQVVFMLVDGSPYDSVPQLVLSNVLWVLLWAFAIRNPTGIAAAIQLAKMVLWIGLIFALPFDHPWTTAAGSLICAALLFAARRLDRRRWVGSWEPTPN